MDAAEQAWALCSVHLRNTWKSIRINFHLQIYGREIVYYIIYMQRSRYVGLPGHLWAGDMCVSPVQHVQVDGDRHEA